MTTAQTNDPKSTSTLAAAGVKNQTLTALADFDDRVRDVIGGEPGSGIVGLLEVLAGQFLGIPRAAFTPPAKPAPAAAEQTDDANHADRTRPAGDPREGADHRGGAAHPKG